MDVPLNVEVRCAEGTCGRSTSIILNPITNQVTHVVVKLEGQEYMVPLDFIVESTPQQIQLRLTKADMEQLEPFDKSRFLARDPAPSPPGAEVAAEESGTSLWPYVPLGRDYAEQMDQVGQVAYEELCVRRGARVEASDGSIGRVEEFLVNPINNLITHLVLREGPMWEQKEITVPISEIDRIEEETVFLKIDKKSVRALPAVPAGPRFWEFRPGTTQPRP